MEATVKFSKGLSYCELEIKEDDGSVSRKKVANDDLVKIFQQQTDENVYLQVPPLLRKWMPENCPYVEGLLYGKRKNGGVSGVFFVPADNRYFNFAGEQMVVPFPALVFLLTAEGGTLCDTYCFALNVEGEELTSLDLPLYAFPYGNVAPETGSICWGSNNLTGITEYKDLKKALITFMSSESNADYTGSGKTYAGAGGYQDFLMRVAGKDKFPKQELLKSNSYETLEQLLDKV